MPKPTKTTKRRSRYRGLGVSILERSGWLASSKPGATEAAERLVLRKLKYTDAGQVRTQTLGYCTRAYAERARAALENQLAKNEGDRVLLDLAGESAGRERFLIAPECERFIRDLGAKAPQATVRNHTVAFQLFLTWCATADDGRPLRYLHELSSRRLAAFNDWLGDSTRKDGRAYKVSTHNQTRKHVRTMLRRLQPKAPQLTSDVLRTALRHVPIVKPDDRAKHGIEHSQPLRSPEIAALLRAALAYDGRPQRRGRSLPPVAPTVALVLLTGMRRAEFTAVRVRDVAAHGDDRRITCDGRAQYVTVNLLGYSSTGVALVDALTAGHGPDEWLSTLSYREGNAVLTRLQAYGGPVCTWHDLRATCAQRQLSLAIDPQLKLDRMGHGADVRAKHYLRFDPDQPVSAPSLEAAMGCEADFAAVVAAAQADPRVAAPRCVPRPDCGPKVRPLLVPPRMELRGLTPRFAQEVAV